SSCSHSSSLSSWYALPNASHCSIDGEQYDLDRRQRNRGCPSTPALARRCEEESLEAKARPRVHHCAGGADRGVDRCSGPVGVDSVTQGTERVLRQPVEPA